MAGILPQSPTMTRHGPDRLVFKTATEAWEIEQIRRLNYRTFVEEIPQHPENPDAVLVDKHDAENTYLICLDGRRLVGMIAVRDRRPFSLDGKLPDLDAYLPPTRKPCEYRLLSVLPAYRTGRALRGLLAEVARYSVGLGHDLAVISGTVRQLKLYRHLGFVPFGPVVGEPGAQYQPMYQVLERLQEWASSRTPPDPDRQARTEARPAGMTGIRPHGEARGNFELADPLNLLPGPVGIAPGVRAALAEAPISHRAERFTGRIADIKRRLRALLDVEAVELLVGTGTLANDAVGGQLSLLDGHGVVVSNGEFGDRLIDHATRWGLNFTPLRIPWGAPVTRAALSRALAASAHGPGIPGWVWAVHCETSTGMLNDLGMLRDVAAAHGDLLCVDCISSIGTVPVDLSGVYLATGASGKGLAAFPGLSMVFADHPLTPAADRLPRYLDLGLYSAEGGVPFTSSSNLVEALGRALEQPFGPERFARIARHAGWLRAELEGIGLRIVTPTDQAAPAVLTVVLPPGLPSAQVGDELRMSGYLLSYESEYLRKRNWIQICLMGEWEPRRLPGLVDRLRTHASGRPEPRASREG